tara:strand:- start:8 stop:877 length:870 start_codon:yes stop_codon:yes gene_type:complete
MFSYSNGKFILTDKVAIPISEDYLGFKCGYRIFSTSTTVNHKFFRIDDHIDRLISSAEEINMEVSLTKKEISDIIKNTIFKNKNIQSEFTIMVFLSGGAPEPMTFKPEGPAKLYVIINKMVIPPKIWYEEGIALASYKYQRQYPNVKLLNYIGSINAHQTVIPKYGAQEALFISPSDNTILEGTTFSFFIIDQKNNVIARPEDKYILGSITRKVIFEILQNNDISHKEEKTKFVDLKNFKEAFLASSIRGIVPVVRIDDHIIGNGKPGQTTLLLSKIYEKTKSIYEYCN